MISVKEYIKEQLEKATVEIDAIESATEKANARLELIRVATEAYKAGINDTEEAPVKTVKPAKTATKPAEPAVAVAEKAAAEKPVETAVPEKVAEPEKTVAEKPEAPAVTAEKPVEKPVKKTITGAKKKTAKPEVAATPAAPATTTAATTEVGATGYKKFPRTYSAKPEEAAAAKIDAAMTEEEDDTPVTPEEAHELVVNHDAFMRAQEARANGEYVVSDKPIPGKFTVVVDPRVGETLKPATAEEVKKAYESNDPKVLELLERNLVAPETDENGYPVFPDGQITYGFYVPPIEKDSQLIVDKVKDIINQHPALKKYGVVCGKQPITWMPPESPTNRMEWAGYDDMGIIIRSDEVGISVDKKELESRRRVRAEMAAAGIWFFLGTPNTWYPGWGPKEKEQLKEEREAAVVPEEEPKEKISIKETMAKPEEERAAKVAEVEEGVLKAEVLKKACKAWMTGLDACVGESADDVMTNSDNMWKLIERATQYAIFDVKVAQGQASAAKQLERVDKDYYSLRELCDGIADPYTIILHSGETEENADQTLGQRILDWAQDQKEADFDEMIEACKLKIEKDREIEALQRKVEATKPTKTEEKEIAEAAAAEEEDMDAEDMDEEAEAAAFEEARRKYVSQLEEEGYDIYSPETMIGCADQMGYDEDRAAQFGFTEKELGETNDDWTDAMLKKYAAEGRQMNKVMELYEKEDPATQRQLALWASGGEFEILNWDYIKPKNIRYFLVMLRGYYNASTDHDYEEELA